MKKGILSTLLTGGAGLLLIILFMFSDLSPWELSISAKFQQLEKKLTILFLVMLIFHFMVIVFLNKILNNITKNKRAKKDILFLIIGGFCIPIILFFLYTSSHYDLEISASFIQLERKALIIYILMIIMNIIILKLLYKIYKYIK